MSRSSLGSCDILGAGGDAPVPLKTSYDYKHGVCNSSSDDRCTSDSGSIELPSALLGAAGGTHASSSANFSLHNTADSRAFARLSFEMTQPAPVLPRVHLTNADRQRLTTLARLMKSESIQTVLDCCSVFLTEILQDFPAHVFLREPQILEVLISTIESVIKLDQHGNLTASALKCLCKVAEKLVTQVLKYQDPSMIAQADELEDAESFRHSWSLLEFCWSGLSTASLCIRTSDLSSVLVESLSLLKVCLATHAAFFPGACDTELGRLALLLADVITSKPPTFAYLQVLHLIKQYILKQARLLKQSQILVQVIQVAVLSPGVWCLNPELAQDFIIVLKNVPRDDKFWREINGVTGLCQALTSANKLIELSGKNCSQQLVEESLMSLDFMPDLLVAKLAIECAAREIELETTSVVLSLLAHSNLSVQARAYHHCHHVVLASIGVGQAKDPVSYIPENISFLTDVKVLQEIICFGLESENEKVKFQAEDMLVNLIRSRLIVSPVLWSQISSCVAFLIPFLASKIHKYKSLYRTFMSYLNPENRSSHSFQCIRGNACLLFSNKKTIRSEASKRLLWIVENHRQSGEKWPQLSIVKIDSPSMTSLCIVEEPLVLTSNIATLFYNESSLRQIVGLLGPQGTDPSVRHSALCQLAAMLQEPRLHSAFLEAGGLDICVVMLDDALVRNNVDVLSKSVKPIVSILCRVLGNDITVCHTMAQDENLLLNLCRAMFLYSNVDVDFKQHCSAVLALLLFSDIVRQKPDQPVEERLVLPHQVLQGLHIPIRVGSYARVSSHTSSDCWQRLRTSAGERSDDLALLLRCHMTLERLSVLEINSENDPRSQLSKQETRILLQYDVANSLQRALHAVETATTHTQVFAAMSELRSYLPYPIPGDLNALPWNESFMRFLAQPPATHADATLLAAVVNLLAEHHVTDWISHEDIVLKLDPLQSASVQTFLPLVRGTVKTMDKEAAANTIVALCKCLLVAFQTSDNELLRAVLISFGEIAREHDLKFSSRVMAELIAPLVDVVGRFDSDGSFVSLGLIEEALHSLCLLQTNNCQNFCHHFCAYSENCDIYNVLLQLISSDKTVAKASSLCLLSGLATCNGMRNNTMDLAAYIQKSICLTLDKSETCFVRQQCVVFLSCVINNPVTIPNADVFIRLLTEYNWFLQVAEISKNLYLKDTFEFSCYENIASPCGLSNSVLKQLVTPDYLSAHYKLLYNLIVVAPYSITMKVIEFGIFTKSVELLCTCIADTSNLRADVCSLITQVSSLISFCLITDEQEVFASELNNFPYLAPAILALLDLKEFEHMSAAIFWLIVAMEQAGYAGPFLLAFERGLFWKSLCLALEDSETSKSAMLLIRALTLQSKSSRPSDTASSVDVDCIQVCECLLVQLQNDECHQTAMAALAGLFAGWPPARKAAVKSGLLENIGVAVRQCRIGLLLVQDMRHLASTTQMHPLVEELVDTFELLVGFLLNDDSIKVTASDTVLADELNQLWPICLLNSRLCDAALKFLAVYSSGCEEACTSLLLRQQTVAGVKIKRCAPNVSLIQQLATLASRELTSSINTTPACLALRSLQQCCVSVECRTTIVKMSILRDIFVTGGGVSRLPADIQKAALLMTQKLTRHAEGQLALARIAEAVESLCVIATEMKGESEICLLATEILKNLCFCHANRVLILTSSKLLACFLRLLTYSGPPQVRLVAAALWSLSANHHRSKQALKVAGFQQALAKAMQICQCQETASVIESALKTLAAS